jgi:hypothetical protein
VNSVALGPDEAVPGRAFASPGETERDTAILETMREALARRVESAGADGSWRDQRGDEHLLVIPDVDALVATVPAVAVGFFGQAREGVDHSPILALEHSLLGRAATLPGLLGYHDVFLARDRQWGNLVVFAADDDPAAVAGDDEHQVAIGLTGAHYHSLRLHRYALPDGALGQASLRWIRTTYLDFGDSPPWRAVRRASTTLA